MLDNLNPIMSGGIGVESALVLKLRKPNLYENGNKQTYKHQGKVGIVLTLLR